MKSILILLCLYFNFLVPSFAQKVTNWHSQVTLHSLTNYDFDLNRATGPAIKTNCHYRIDIEDDGTGKIYVIISGAYGGNSQKKVYSIQSAYYRSYTDGKTFISIQSEDLYNTKTFQVALKNKKKIKRIALINKNNEGTLTY